MLTIVIHMFTILSEQAKTKIIMYSNTSECTILCYAYVYNKSRPLTCGVRHELAIHVGSFVHLTFEHDRTLRLKMEVNVCVKSSMLVRRLYYNDVCKFSVFRGGHSCLGQESSDKAMSRVRN